MNSISRLITFLIYSNFWIGAGAALFTWEFYWLHKLEPDYYVILFTFFATVLTYTFQRSVKLLLVTRRSSDRLIWMKRHDLLVKTILILSAVGCVRTLFNFSMESFLLLFVCGLLSLFYIVKLPGKIGKNLRDIPSLKIFLIGLVWAATSSFLPYFNLNGSTGSIPWVWFFANFVFIIAITIPFDIRDLELDEPDKKTIPQLLGEKRSIFLSILLLSCYWPMLCLIADGILYVSLIGVCLSIVLVNGSKKATNDFYFSFFIDGLLIVLPVLLYLDLLLIGAL